MKQIGTMPGGSLIVELTPSDIEKLNAILDATTKAYKGTLSLFQTMPPMAPLSDGKRTLPKNHPLLNANPAILSHEELSERLRVMRQFNIDDPRALAEVAKREEESKKAQES